MVPLGDVTVGVATRGRSLHLTTKQAPATVESGGDGEWEGEEREEVGREGEGVGEGGGRVGERGRDGGGRGGGWEGWERGGRV